MTAQPTAPKRWARDYVFDILKELGIHYIFGVPGTNEIPIIDGTSYPENGVDYIECLHENIAIGAAMGSARMTGKPAVLVVHVTPGIAHSIGNLFNAWRSNIPLVILCCQQQNELVTQEPLLASNLVDLARQYTSWAHEVRTAEELPLVLQRAFKQSMAPPNSPVFISIPWEFNMRRIGPEDRIKGVTRISSHFTGDIAAIEEAARALAVARNPIIVAGDAVGVSQSWCELAALAERIGAPVLLQTFSSVANFPNNDYHWQGELPGSQADLQDVFAKHDTAFFVGFARQAQITVFKYSDGPLVPDHVHQVYLSNDTWDLGKNYYGETAVFGDVKATLPLITERIPESRAAKTRNTRLRTLDAERRTQWTAYLDLARKQPDIWAVLVAEALRKQIAAHKLERKFVYVHEAVSDPAPFQYLLPLGTQAAPISYYCVSGGSLGWSMPASLGIALEPKAVQDIEPRLVINAVGDGSSLFYPQTWWTAAHRKLAVLYIITNNREYHTLQLGLQTVVGAYGAAKGYEWEPKTMDPDYLRIERPQMDFVALAKAVGGLDGLVVRRPDEVDASIAEAVSYVLEKRRSFVLDVRTDQNTPAPPPTDAAGVQVPLRYSAQPRLDLFHAGTGRTKKARGLQTAHVPVIF